MADQVWFGNNRWPSGRNLGEFARDIFRIEGCKTDREKAMAFFKWTIRCFLRGPNYDVPDGFGTYSRTFDPLRMYFSFGSFECTGWGWSAAEALQAAGLKARRVVGQNDGHTIYEVWYKGKDGKEGWHAFDNFQGWYFLNRNGEVASCEELTADHNLVHDPLGTADPACYNIDLSYLMKRHDWADALDIVQHVQNETLSWSLRPGMEIASLFEPADPSRTLYCGDTYPRGPHCQIPEFDHTGALLFPDHEPFWRPYRRNFMDNSWVGTHRPVRCPGAGALRWTPLLYGRETAAWADHAVFENNEARPSGVSKHCEIWYEIDLPYYASYLQIEGFVKASGSDYAGIGISADKGRTITPLLTGIKGNFRMLNGLEERKKRTTSVQFSRRFHIRFDLHGHTPVLPVIQGLRITAGYQHNMFVQPLLLPGKNRLWLEAKKVSGEEIRARWNYCLKGKAASTELVLGREGRVEKGVEMKALGQEEIVMHGVVLSCGKAGKGK